MASSPTAFSPFSFPLGGGRRIITARFLLEKRGSHKIFPFSGTIVREYEILLDYVAG